ncbi:MAG: menaquinone biosynthesis decarboxylase, partial [Candidatus Bathyarchaeia archaeon]
MADLRGFLKELEEEDDLLEIDEPLSPRFEIPAVLRRFEGGKALLFEDVEGYETRVVGGVCGTRRRILKALGVESEGFYRRLLHAVRNPT